VSELTELIVDLNAAGFGIDTATQAVGGGIGGPFGGLQRLLKVGFDDAKSDAENFAEAIEIVRERYGGLAREMANTPTGQLKQMQNAVRDLREELGRAVLQAGQPWVLLLKESAGSITAFAQQSETAKFILVSSFSAIAVSLGAVSTALIAVKVNATLVEAGLSRLSNMKILITVGIVFDLIALGKAFQEGLALMDAKAKKAIAKSQLLERTRQDREALEAEVAKMVAAGTLAKETADQILADLASAFAGGDVDAQRAAVRTR
jgi:hypothetical protein